MKLNERIRKCRLDASLSQEEVAELVGVSRQAVTKWELGQSSPSTENLFRLAEIFGTTVDMLLPKYKDEEAKEAVPENVTSPTGASVEELYEFYTKMKKFEREERKKKICRNILTALAFLCYYVLFFYICRLIWGDISHSSLVGFLFTDDAPSGENSYLYGWLISSNLYFYAAAISILPSLLGKRIYSTVTAAGFLLGFILGVLFGPNPEGAPFGHGHYGWAIFCITFLISIVLGVIAEIIAKRKEP